MNTAHTADLWPTTKTKTGQREAKMEGRGRGWREKEWREGEAPGENHKKTKQNAKTTLIGPRSSSHVMLFENTVYQSYPIYCKLLHSAGTVGSHTHTHTLQCYLSVEASVLTSALSGSTPPWLLHLHFFRVFQLQGLQLLNNTGATADPTNTHTQTHRFKYTNNNPVSISWTLLFYILSTTLKRHKSLWDMVWDRTS